jgi:hypothetical protein
VVFAQEQNGMRVAGAERRASSGSRSSWRERASRRASLGVGQGDECKKVDAFERDFAVGATPVFVDIDLTDLKLQYAPIRDEVEACDA